jgi:hypothetical protein
MSARNRAGVCLITAATILLVAASGRDPRQYAAFVFALAIGLAILEGCLCLWWRQTRAGVAIILIAAVLAACASLPRYVEHANLDPEDTTHRHTLWELGHDH